MLVRVAREPVLALYRSLVAGAESGEALPYEALVNAVCMGLGVDAEEQHALLCMDSVIDRGRRACELAARRPRPPRPGPPAAGDHN